MAESELQIVIDRPAPDHTDDGEAPPTYHPGEHIRGHVLVTTRTPAAAISLTIGIQCTANLKRLSILQLTLHDGLLDPDQRSFAFDFECPKEPLSHVGANSIIEWSLVASFAMPQTETVEDRATVRVLAPSDAAPIVSATDTTVEPSVAATGARLYALVGALVVVPNLVGLIALMQLPEPAPRYVAVAGLLAWNFCAALLGYPRLQAALARAPVSKLIGRFQREPGGALRVDLDISAIRPITGVSVDLAFENTHWNPETDDWEVARERLARHHLRVDGSRLAAGSVRFVLPEPRERGLWNFETTHLKSGWVVVVTVEVQGRPESQHTLPFSVTPGPRSLVDS